MGCGRPRRAYQVKELLYIDGFQISRAGKVLTPNLSPIYRYKMKKETKNVVSDSANVSTGGPSGTRTQDTWLKRPLL